MGEIVNLRLVRKAKARDDKTRIADENRARHGRTKSEKQLDRVSAEKSAAFLDSHKRAAPTSPSMGLRGRSSDRASGSIVGREGRGDCEAIGVPGVEPQSGAGGGDGASPDHPSGRNPRD